MLRRKYSKLWYLVGILLAANVAVWTSSIKAESRNFGIVHFFDVGQGDAIYIRTVEGNDILIDGGPGDAVLGKLGEAMPFNDRAIELVILTHPHADHVSGLVEALKRYRVKNILMPESVYDSATYGRFLELVKEKHVKIILPKLGQRIFFDRETVFDVYFPVTGKFVKLPSDINDVSIVGKMSFGKSNILLTGDAGQDIERLLLALGLPLDSEILKVGHHGSRHSTSPEFVKAVSPEESVISVGKGNSYGHPHPEVLGALASLTPEVLRTDEKGDILFKIYPDRISLQTK